MFVLYKHWYFKMIMMNSNFCMFFLPPFILLIVIFSIEHVPNFQFGEYDSCFRKVLQMSDCFMKLVFHADCSDAKSCGISNWCYLNKFLAVMRANSLRIYSDKLE